MATASTIFIVLAALAGIGATAIRKSIAGVVEDPAEAGRARSLQASGRRRAALLLAGLGVILGIVAIVLGHPNILYWICGAVVTAAGALTYYRVVTAPIVVPRG